MSDDRCTQFDAPWDCSQEAAARYENIKRSGFMAGHSIGLEWCDYCSSHH